MIKLLSAGNSICSTLLSAAVRNKLPSSLTSLRCLSTAPGASNQYSSSWNASLSVGILNESNNTTHPLGKDQINYKCPSIKSFQLPLIDISIVDILKRQVLKLPEINENKEVSNPRQKDQVDKIMPSLNIHQNTKIYCERSLFSELKWRRRRMNKLKRRKYEKKMFFTLQKRKQAKEKRYQTVLNLYRTIEMKKVELFDPVKFIKRELEKAKFFGYKANTLYDQYRQVVDSNLKSFDEKFFRTFPEYKKPYNVFEEDDTYKKERARQHMIREAMKKLRR